MREKILALAESLGLKDVAFVTANAEKDLKYAICAVVPLSPYVVQEIDTAPTHSYFHHYRTINTYIDQCQLRLGMLLQENGYLYLPIPGSQSINT
ncbi:MAG: epoxyqueuosine reductase, partial [Oscillospiraceae bacterium]|nr:epoxyqueuosine reductase [Oscillospiraceae bacterium]